MKQRIMLAVKLGLLVAMAMTVYCATGFPEWMTGRVSANERLLGAIASNNSREFEAALAAGASPSDLTVARSRPLMDAADVGNMEMTRQLLRAGVDVDGADSAGTTPLMAAARQDHVEIVEFLLRCGANTGRRDWLNRTALDLAIEGSCNRAAQALRAATTRGI